MDALTAIRTRRSTRDLKRDRVAREVLETLIEAGRMAPSGGNSQTTRFIVIQDRQILDELADIVREAFAAMPVEPGMYASLKHAIDASQRGDYRFHYDAPVLIVTANRLGYGNNVADCACALENMMIAANALGLGSCWINQLRWLNDHPAVNRRMRELGMQPDECVCGGLIVGWPDTGDGQPLRAPRALPGNPVVWHTNGAD